MMIIERPSEVSSLSKGKWILVYGRRKTGKTFLVENFVNYEGYKRWKNNLWKNKYISVLKKADKKR